MRWMRLAPEGFFVADDGESLRWLHSDPLTVSPQRWELGGPVDRSTAVPLLPVAPSKIVGVGRNYRAHAEELGNPVPAEPLLFLKAPSSLIGPRQPVQLPPESSRVDFEGEIALVVGQRLTRASRWESEDALAGVSCALDITARDLQRQDATFARGKSFDSFCPFGPAVRHGSSVEHLRLETRINGEVRQRGGVDQMIFAPWELLVYISRHMTLEPGDVVLTGTPSGVGPLQPGDLVEVEMEEVGTLTTPIEALQLEPPGAPPRSSEPASEMNS
ncbi:MAG: fumarylacetoacetate hydrolase family protein [Acidobacteriota bacterium]